MYVFDYSSCRFWTEIYQGAKLFYLSGLDHEEYLKREVHNLGRFISVMKFNPVLVSFLLIGEMGVKISVMGNLEFVRSLAST